MINTIFVDISHLPCQGKVGFQWTYVTRRITTIHFNSDTRALETWCTKCVQEGWSLSPACNDTNILHVACPETLCGQGGTLASSLWRQSKRYARPLPLPALSSHPPSGTGGLPWGERNGRYHLVAIGTVIFCGGVTVNLHTPPLLDRMVQ